MKFTVIIPTYNRKYYTKIAIDSVLHQNFQDFELIVIDDASTDGTKEMLARYNKNKKIKTITHQKNKGVSASRNSGIKIAQGEWICFLDSDDRFRKDKLEQTNDYIKLFPEYKIFHTEEIWYSQSRVLGQKKKHKKPDGDAFAKSLKMCCIGPSTVCVHKSLFKKHGLFDTKLPACEDYDLWLRLSPLYDVKLIPHSLTIKEGGRIDQLSSQRGLDKYRIIALDKLIKSKALNKDQSMLANAELEHKLELFRKGCLKHDNVSEYEELMIYLRS